MVDKVIKEIGEAVDAVEDVVVQLNDLEKAKNLEEILKEIRDVSVAFNNAVKEIKEVTDEIKKFKKSWWCCG
jgi:methyl-accepting chemotaxis protein